MPDTRSNMEVMMEAFSKRKPITEEQIIELLDKYYEKHGIPPSVNGKKVVITIEDGKVTIQEQ